MPPADRDRRDDYTEDGVEPTGAGLVGVDLAKGSEDPAK